MKLCMQCPLQQTPNILNTQLKCITQEEKDEPKEPDSADDDARATSLAPGLTVPFINDGE